MELVYPNWKTLITSLKIKQVTIYKKYLNFINVYFLNSAIKLPEHSKIKNHFIDPEKGKQLLYRLIYSLGLVKLKTLKTYIKIYLASGFIKFLQLLTSAYNLFICKKDGKVAFGWGLIIKCSIIW